MQRRGFSVAEFCKEADILIIVGGGGAGITGGGETKNISYVYVIIVEWSTGEIVNTHAMIQKENEIRLYIKDNIGFALDKYF